MSSSPRLWPTQSWPSPTNQARVIEMPLHLDKRQIASVETKTGWVTCVAAPVDSVLLCGATLTAVATGVGSVSTHQRSAPSHPALSHPALSCQHPARRSHASIQPGVGTHS
jgi:hypothetical protein